MARKGRKARERQETGRSPGKATEKGTGHSPVRCALTAGLGILLFLSQPYFSPSFRLLPGIGPFLPVVLLPAILGAFTGLSVTGFVRGGVLGFLVPVAGSVMVWFYQPGAFPWSSPGGIALIQGAIAAAASIATVFAKRKLPVSRLAIVVLALVLLNFALLVDHGKDRVYSGSAFEPPAESYNFDGVFFLKVFYLMEHGQDYYRAWDLAFQGDIRYDRPFPEVWGWRMPTLYWIWSAAASRGDTLVVYFVLLSLAGMVSIHLAASKHSDPVLGLWSAGLLGSYLHFGAITFWYTITDYWSFFFALPAMALYLHGRRNLALPLALLAGLMREWAALMLVAGFLDNLLNRRWRDAGAWAAGCALAGCGFLLHWHHVAEYLRQAGATALTSRVRGVGGSGGPMFLLYTSAYASRFFLGGPIILYIVFLVGLLGAGRAWVRFRAAFPLLVVLAVFGVLMVYGHGMKPGDPPGTGDYYSINYMPYLIMSVPFALHPLWKLRESPG